MTLDIATLSERDIAKMIDHSLLKPELDDAYIEAGCRLAAKYDVASVCCRPADIVRAAALLRGTDVHVGSTIGFPHGNHLTSTKVHEARVALADGATELDMVLQIAEKLPGAKVSAIQQVVEGRLKALDQFRRFSYAMAGVVVFIGSLIVFVTMMGSVNERTTEIGVFRAIGFRRSHIMRIILLEAAVVGSGAMPRIGPVSG